MKLTIFLLPALLVIAACSSVNLTDPPLPVHYGAYAGIVKLYSISGDTVTESGTTVTLLGTGYSTTAAWDGSYLIEHVPTGTYTLQFTRPGYDTAMILADHFSGEGTSTMLTQDLQAIPYDSVICDSVGFYFDWTPNKTHDTVSNMILYGKVKYPSLLVQDRDFVYVASIRIVREDANGNSATVVSGDLISIWPRFDHTFATYIDSTAHPSPRVRAGDKLSIYLRAASVPLVSSPVVYSPFVTRKEVVVQ